MHMTYFPASDESWGTFTEEDNFGALDASTGVTYSGHDTAWGNYNINQPESQRHIHVSRSAPPAQTAA